MIVYAGGIQAKRGQAWRFQVQSSGQRRESQGQSVEAQAHGCKWLPTSKCVHMHEEADRE